MRDNFWLNGISAADFDIVLQKEIEFSAAEADVEAISVPGRSGDIIYTTGAFKNVKGEATCYCLTDKVATTVATINNWLYKSADYQRLETMVEPDIYRMARLVRCANLEARLNKINPFVLEFDCKPQRFRKDGDIAVTMTTSSSLYNPTSFDAKPLIVVNGSGSGTLSIGSNTLTLTDCNNITLDCESRRAYRGTTNMNSTVSGAWAVLPSGMNNISFSGGITSVQITPRWWTL